MEHDTVRFMFSVGVMPRAVDQSCTYLSWSVTGVTV